jgi:hypothetical protein
MPAIRPACRWMRSFAVALAGISTACTRNPAPSGWLAPPHEAQSDPYGAWIVVTREDTSDVGGELLAVERDSLFVLTSDSAVNAFATDRLLRATVAYYDSEWGRLATWTALGSLGTISNGFVLILTLPISAIGGSVATAAQSRAPIRRVERGGNWEDLRMFARFPAGLPANLPRTLAPKPRG